MFSDFKFETHDWRVKQVVRFRHSSSSHAESGGIPKLSGRHIETPVALHSVVHTVSQQIPAILELSWGCRATSANPPVGGANTGRFGNFGVFPVFYRVFLGP